MLYSGEQVLLGRGGIVPDENVVYQPVRGRDRVVDQVQLYAVYQKLFRPLFKFQIIEGVWRPVCSPGGVIRSLTIFLTGRIVPEDAEFNIGVAIGDAARGRAGHYDGRHLPVRGIHRGDGVREGSAPNAALRGHRRTLEKILGVLLVVRHELLETCAGEGGDQTQMMHHGIGPVLDASSAMALLLFQRWFRF